MKPPSSNELAKYYEEASGLMNNNNPTSETKRETNMKDRGYSFDVVLHKRRKQSESSQKGNYVIKELIGKGSFGEVRLGNHILSDSPVAIKIIDKQTSSLSGDSKECASGQLGKIYKEIDTLKALSHQNLIQVFEIMESKRYLYVIMEYCENKDLYDYLVEKDRLSEEEAKNIFTQILSGVAYLHEQKIAHRDLKLENVLLDEKLNVKITDFGLSKEYSSNSILETPCGTPAYACPKKIVGEAYNPEKSDVWALGIILYTLLMGFLPFNIDISRTNMVGFSSLSENDLVFRSDISEAAINLIRKMLIIEENLRFSLFDVVQHCWLANRKMIILNGNSTQRFISFDTNAAQTAVNLSFPMMSEPEKASKIEEVREKISLNKYDPLTALYRILSNQEKKKSAQMSLLVCLIEEEEKKQCLLSISEAYHPLFKFRIPNKAKLSLPIHKLVFEVDNPLVRRKTLRSKSLMGVKSDLDYFVSRFQSSCKHERSGLGDKQLLLNSSNKNHVIFDSPSVGISTDSTPKLTEHSKKIASSNREKPLKPQLIKAEEKAQLHDPKLLSLSKFAKPAQSHHKKSKSHVYSSSNNGTALPCKAKPVPILHSNVVDMSCLIACSSTEKLSTHVQQILKNQGFSSTLVSAHKFYVMKNDLTFTLSILALDTPAIYYLSCKVKSGKPSSKNLQSVLSRIVAKSI